MPAAVRAVQAPVSRRDLLRLQRLRWRFPTADGFLAVRGVVPARARPLTLSVPSFDAADSHVPRAGTPRRDPRRVLTHLRESSKAGFHDRQQLAIPGTCARLPACRAWAPAHVQYEHCLMPLP